MIESVALNIRATVWELLLERWDAVRADLPMMDVSQVRSRWLLPLFETLDFDPVYLRGDTVLDEAGKLRYSLSHRGWDEEDAPTLHTVISSQDLDARMATGRGVKTKSPQSCGARMRSGGGILRSRTRRLILENYGE